MTTGWRQLRWDQGNRFVHIMHKCTCVCIFQTLEKCCKLEELILDNNCLSDPPTIVQYTRLQGLSLSNNCLVTLPQTPPTQPLLSLTYLNISGNNISCLQGIEVPYTTFYLHVMHYYSFLFYVSFSPFHVFKNYTLAGILLAIWDNFLLWK